MSWHGMACSFFILSFFSFPSVRPSFHQSILPFLPFFPCFLVFLLCPPPPTCCLLISQEEEKKLRQKCTTPLPPHPRTLEPLLAAQDVAEGVERGGPAEQEVFLCILRSLSNLLYPLPPYSPSLLAPFLSVPIEWTRWCTIT
jgi:hypothetical protein